MHIMLIEIQFPMYFCNTNTLGLANIKISLTSLRFIIWKPVNSVKRCLIGDEGILLDKYKSDCVVAVEEKSRGQQTQ